MADRKICYLVEAFHKEESKWDADGYETLDAARKDAQRRAGATPGSTYVVYAPVEAYSSEPTPVSVTPVHLDS